nr:MAG TPA: chromosome partitioning protein [Caudoviricetes sp.]
MARFDMGEFAKTLAQPVSGPDTGREQIEYIDVDLLDSDPNNFYRLSELDALADNIAVIGLQQPIRVRDGEGGHAVIVSGHRRAAAIRKLVADGRGDLRQVPCIREAAASSAALQELRLIYANSATRDLSGAEISQQAEKIRQLLYQLKEEGYEFPGRMRDHVAEACRISKSKLARLDAIRNNLAPDIRKAYWDKGGKTCLSEEAAYELSRLPVDLQRQVVDAYRRQDRSDTGLKCLYASDVEAVVKAVKKIADGKVKCPPGGMCEHKNAQIAHTIEARLKNRWADCGCEHGCCEKCSTLQSCRDVCPKTRDKQKALKAQSRTQKRHEAEERQAKERPAVERITSLWQRFGCLREQAGLTVKKYFEKIDCPYGSPARDAEEHEAGRKIDAHTELPFGYNVYLSDINRWLAAADALGCSVDYLMLRTDEPRTADEVAAVPQPCAGEAVLAAWMPGGTTPAAPCDVVAEFDLSGDGKVVSRTLCRWDGEAFRFGKCRDKIEVRVVRWLALPEVEKEDEGDD